MEKLEIGPVPSSESCEQLGPNYRPHQALLECRTFVQQLERAFPKKPEGVSFVITRNPHDFGTYLEVAVKFDPDRDDHCDYAYEVEGNAPEYWDAESREALGLPGGWLIAVCGSRHYGPFRDQNEVEAFGRENLRGQNWSIHHLTK